MQIEMRKYYLFRVSQIKNNFSYYPVLNILLDRTLFNMELIFGLKGNLAVSTEI